jgi:hypothetical protein
VKAQACDRKLNMRTPRIYIAVSIDPAKSPTLLSASTQIIMAFREGNIDIDLTKATLVISSLGTAAFALVGKQPMRRGRIDRDIPQDRKREVRAKITPNTNRISRYSNCAVVMKPPSTVR